MNNKPQDNERRKNASSDPFKKANSEGQNVPVNEIKNDLANVFASCLIIFKDFIVLLNPFIKTQSQIIPQAAVHNKDQFFLPEGVNSGRQLNQC